MAKVRLGALAQDIRGSQAGLTFSRNKGGAYVRQRVAPTNVSSDARTRQRNIFSANAKAWSGALTDDQRGAWSLFAAANPITDVFGASIILSGISMYQRLNAVLQTVSEPVISDPPSDLTVDPLALGTALNVGTGFSEMTIATAAQTVVADTLYYIWAAAPMSMGRTPQNSNYRYIGTKPGVAAATSINIQSLYVAKFGTPAAGTKLAVLLAQVSISKGAVLAGQVFTATFSA